MLSGGKGQGGMEGGIRVPTLARFPGEIPAGTVLDMPSSLMDILPTVAELVGQKTPNDRIIDGVSILSQMKGQSSRLAHDFFVHYCCQSIHAARLVVGKPCLM